MRVTLHGLPNQRRTTATNMTLLGNFFPSHFFRFTLCPLGSLLEVQLPLFLEFCIIPRVESANSQKGTLSRLDPVP